MQRPSASSSYRPSGHHPTQQSQHVIDVVPQLQSKQSPRRRTEGLADPRILDRSATSRGEILRSGLSVKWIHCIPVIVLICLFVLWWFSYRVNLETRDGRIIAVHRIRTPEPFNDTRVDLTVLALATAPNASSVPQLLPLNNDTIPHPETMGLIFYLLTSDRSRFSDYVSLQQRSRLFLHDLVLSSKRCTVLNRSYEFYFFFKRKNFL
ncbi:uncharacterized protein LOC127797904 [Diospyros lotus]|uniref:uncharacterized protein LOC127797904 n=1 Tax=Diospyros lotus TaxID=55363 RepID=UPI00225142E4|nr:uncharacterized protein LOC127797904 [Diospyros lotus]